MSKSKNPKHVEVLVASMIPIMWDVVNKTIPHIAIQSRNSADADYIAFFRVRLEDKNGKLYSDITHIAKVKSSNNDALSEDYYKKHPELLKISEKEGKGWGKHKYHKEYYLEELEKLSHSISCRKGEGKRCQVKFYTTRKELDKANYLSDIRTISQLKKIASSRRKDGEMSDKVSPKVIK